MKTFFYYIFQDYFEIEDVLFKKIESIIKAFIWPSVPSEKICVWVRLSFYFRIKKNKYLKQYYQRKIFKKFNCSISCDSICDKQLYFPHPQNIVIGEGVSIGKNVTIYQGVTIGRKNKTRSEYPSIGNNVVIYCNSTIIGNVKIGDNVIIGAHSLVTKDVPDNAIVGGIPAKVIKYRSEKDEFY